MAFLGVNFWSRDFFLEALKGFFGVLIFASISSSPSLEIRSTPGGNITRPNLSLVINVLHL